MIVACIEDMFIDQRLLQRVCLTFWQDASNQFGVGIVVHLI
jgi:hypothetical protein